MIRNRDMISAMAPRKTPNTYLCPSSLRGVLGGHFFAAVLILLGGCFFRQQHIGNLDKTRGQRATRESVESLQASWCVASGRINTRACRACCLKFLRGRKSRRSTFIFPGVSVKQIAPAWVKVPKDQEKPYRSSKTALVTTTNRQIGHDAPV